jgi:glycosyltransferase involved in cell wall biosynthesis
MKASIIIRSKNEEKWIGLCLDAIFAQNFKDFEVILVDNESSDATVQKAQSWPIKLLKIKEFLPGDAINKGIEGSSGDIIICLSAHCIPSSKDWLSSLVEPLTDESIAGVYGKQIPLSSSSALNKRDLFIVFGDEARVQKQDTFFHNANSSFRRETWKRYPFDPIATNIEDRLWGQDVIKAGLKIAYQPSACVYHHHGIHQDADETRASKIVNIMENDAFSSDQLNEVKGDTRDLAIIYDIKSYDSFRESLLIKAIDSIQSSKKFSDIIFSGTCKNAFNICKQRNISIVDRNRIKGQEMSLGQSLKDALQFFEQSSYIPDSVTVTSVNYPFKNISTYKDLLEGFYNSAMLPTVFGYLEKRPMISVGRKEKIINSDLAPRESMDDGIYICPIGHGYTDTPEHFRSEALLLGKINLLPNKKSISFHEVESKEDMIDTKES